MDNEHDNRLAPDASAAEWREGGRRRAAPANQGDARTASHGVQSMVSKRCVVDGILREDLTRATGSEGIPMLDRVQELGGQLTTCADKVAETVRDGAGRLNSSSCSAPTVEVTGRPADPLPTQG